MLKGKHVLLGVSGGIAVYKSLELISLLRKEGAIVKTIMTKSAMEFISPMTFKSISGETVSYSMFDENKPIEHISLADWADIFIIAPATANIIGKIASGVADDLLSTSILAGKATKIIVPTMNVFMYENKAVQRNLHILKDLGYIVLEPDTGHLACGYSGKGRFPDPKDILDAINVYSFFYVGDTPSKTFHGKRILVTAGASVEKIDPMRFISNRSSGKMGISLAKVAYLMGAKVTLIYSKVSEKIPYYIDAHSAETAVEMYNSVMDLESEHDIIIMCAAVADYTIEKPFTEKLKKGDDLTLNLVRTKDILYELGHKKTDEQVLVGFAAESENIIANAKAKLIKKNCSYIVANSLYTSGKEDTELTLISKNNEKQIKGPKLATACQLLSEIIV
ncbi:MAG: bifunctional phosphopantothenoylcysteine decarboxylase/phosphopantothenate--cysteine ligase CoaBC [Candidatus Cloacimonadales bacterium]|jgi:phosphopantothenoylcysteine decarboxylase/phosphopantothenate--cysteine ligase|nr:bifunctional phosphopantothenoylcysteine decarboxylase/phosphopantothenate--cysteine ligase CoaBC [Candidatus Cloacimonadales bacterium]